VFRKDKLLTGLDPAHLVGAEIGALGSPHVTRNEGRIIYIDHADTSALRSKYKSHPNVDVSKIVEVDAVWGRQTLSACMGGSTVDYVLASHVIEHVPDMLTWLEEIRTILRAGGRLRLAIPDRRFTFDYRRRETGLCDLLNAYLLKARAPLPVCILDHVLNACELDVHTAWQENFTGRNLTLLHDVEGALHLAKDALENGTYHDVHCWVFTPASFAELLEEACRVGLVNFACDLFYDTEPDDLEFVVGMIESNDRSEMVASWRRMRAFVK
jgi:SAM-dependent methyltransferase